MMIKMTATKPQKINPVSREAPEKKSALTTNITSAKPIAYLMTISWQYEDKEFFYPGLRYSLPLLNSNFVPGCDGLLPIAVP